MTMRVSTFGQSSTVLSNAMNTQAKLAQKQEQQSTGLVSMNYGGLGADAGSLVNLEVSIARAKSTISASETALNRVQTQYSVLGSINDVLTEMRSELASVLSSEDINTLQIAAKEMLLELGSLVNTQYQGRYLFAGSETETMPIDLSAYAAADIDTVDSSYYQGDSEIQSVRLTEDRALTYGVTGDNSGLEQAFRGLSYAANTDPISSEDLQKVAALLVSAQDEVIALQSSMGYKAATLENVIESKDEYIVSVESIVTDLTSVDIAEVAVQAATYKTQLEASYSALGTLSSLSLLDYLR
ncbi:flagellin [Roseibium limicola]|uniref:Flagellin n=1 Tax=Roseibium limicola TaxID=2816037 RepID=A0A939J7U7_9HYPH|nr:flagellin [Roseibium limicola]MBO0346552.1 flagellin [Roseibium limicola]